jgi:dienelactone hydrolase
VVNRNFFHAMRVALTLLLVCITGSTVNAQYNYNQAGINNATLSGQNVTYSDSTGASLQGYFAYDNSTNARRGLVLILPDWDGIGPYERWRADLLASMGYAAMVADIYTTAVQQGPSMPQANRSMNTMRYSTNQTLYVARINGALDTAKQQPVVDSTKIVAIGYCFGGGGVMQLARSYPSASSQGLLGVVSFHGSQLAYKPGDRNFTQSSSNLTVVIQNGYIDPSNNASQLASLQEELQRALVPFYLTNYGETVHAFTEPDLAVWTPATQGTQAYTKLADIVSWWNLRAVLLLLFGNVDQATNPYVGRPGVFDTASNMLAVPTS